MRLRLTLVGLGTVTIPSLLPIPRAQEVFDEQGVPADPAIERRAFSMNWTDMLAP